MSADIACRGRIGRDPDMRETKSGDPMALSSMAVTITGHGCEEEQVLWLGMVAFGKVAERLGKLRRGDTASIHGQFTQKPYTSSDGEHRDGFSVLVESIVSHRPKVGKPREKKSIAGTASHTDFLNDPLPEAMR